jgi:site-specific recombinase XerD
MGNRTSGPLFLNSRGRAWTPNAISCRMKQLRKKLGLPLGTVAYAYRHSHATRALVNGADLATVAELLGHGDLKMLSQHYGHLDKLKDHLKRAAAVAVRFAK